VEILPDNKRARQVCRGRGDQRKSAENQEIKQTAKEADIQKVYKSDILLNSWGLTGSLNALKRLAKRT
jgi:hypothetical protein